MHWSLRLAYFCMRELPTVDAVALASCSCTCLGSAVLVASEAAAHSTNSPAYSVLRPPISSSELPLKVQKYFEYCIFVLHIFVLYIHHNFSVLSVRIIISLIFSYLWNVVIHVWCWICRFSAHVDAADDIRCSSLYHLGLLPCKSSWGGGSSPSTTRVCAVRTSSFEKQGS